MASDTPEVCFADLHAAALPPADLLQQVPSLRLDQQCIVLLVLCSPDLKHTHGLITQLDGPDVNLCTKWVDDLLHHVAIAPSALVVDLLNWVFGAQLDTGSHNTPELV